MNQWYIGVDYGRKRIGFSVAEGTLKLVRPWGVIENNSPTTQAQLSAFLSEYPPKLIVVGVTMNAANQEALREDRRNFCKLLTKLTGAAIEHWDEAYSSEDAKALQLEMQPYHRSLGDRRRKEIDRNSIAAALILRNYLESQTV